MGERAVDTLTASEPLRLATWSSDSDWQVQVRYGASHGPAVSPAGHGLRLSVRNAAWALEQLQVGYKVREEECTTSIPDDPNCYIPSVCSSGYPSRSPSPNGFWSRETVEAHKRERRIRQLEMDAKFAEDVAATIRSNQQERKEELAHAHKAGIAARARRARAVLNKAVKDWKYSSIFTIPGNTVFNAGKFNKQYKYKPLIKFGGWTECFSDLVNLEELEEQQTII